MFNILYMHKLAGLSHHLGHVSMHIALLQAYPHHHHNTCIQAYPVTHGTSPAKELAVCQVIDHGLELTQLLVTFGC
jgi:hypothetical protein